MKAHDGGGGGGPGGGPGGDWPVPFEDGQSENNAVQYARELRVVQRLMRAQTSIMMDAQLFRSHRPDATGEDYQDVYQILAFTMDAFKYIFVAVTGAQGELNKLLMDLLSGNLSTAQTGELKKHLAEAKSKYERVPNPSPDDPHKPELLSPTGNLPGDVPDNLYEAFQITEAVMDTYNPLAQRSAVKAAEREAKELRELDTWYKKVTAAAKQMSANLVGEERKRGEATDQTEKERMGSNVDKMKTQLGNLNLIITQIHLAKVSNMPRLLRGIRSIFRKARAVNNRSEGRRRGGKKQKSQVDALDDEIPAELLESDSEEDIEEDLNSLLAGGIAPGTDEGGGVEIIDALDEFDTAALGAILSDIQREARKQSEEEEEVQKRVDEQMMALPDSDRAFVEVAVRQLLTNQQVEAAEGAAGGPSAPPTGSPPPSLPPSPPSDPVLEPMPVGFSPLSELEKKIDDKRKAFEQEEKDDIPKELIALLESDLALVGAHYAEAVRAHDALLRKHAKQKRAIAQVSAYALRAELDADTHARRAEQLAQLNVGLRDLSPQSNGLAYSEYRARLEGIGILDPEACNDSNVDDIDASEVHGWKGQYRLHVGRMLRVLPRGGPDGSPCYHLDALPPTPRQWLESEDVVYAAGPPLPSAIDASAQIDAAMLQETSLEWAVNTIMGPESTRDPGPRAEEEANKTRATLSALLQADRKRLLNARRSQFAPWGFDFDMLAPSSVVSQ